MVDYAKKVGDIRVDGKVIAITGATSGLGKASALELARRGATLALINRNPEKARATKRDIERAVPEATVHLFDADLSSLAQVRRAGGAMCATLPRLDAFISNAGYVATGFRPSAEGWDEMLVTNHLGPFLLIHQVLGLLKASRPSRIVTTVSGAYRMIKTFDPEHMEQIGDYSTLGNRLRAYGHTKLLQVMMADELARRLEGRGVTARSQCPGAVASEGAAAETVLIFRIITKLYVDPAKACMKTVWLASDPALDRITGEHYPSWPGVMWLKESPFRHNEALARRVYERSCELVGVEPVH